MQVAKSSFDPKYEIGSRIEISTAPEMVWRFVVLLSSQFDDIHNLVKVRPDVGIAGLFLSSLYDPLKEVERPLLRS